MVAGGELVGGQRGCGRAQGGGSRSAADGRTTAGRTRGGTTRSRQPTAGPGCLRAGGSGPALAACGAETAGRERQRPPCLVRARLCAAGGAMSVKGGCWQRGLRRPALSRAPAQERAQAGRGSQQGRGAPGGIWARTQRERRGRAGERRGPTLSGGGASERGRAGFTAEGSLCWVREERSCWLK